MVQLAQNLADYYNIRQVDEPGYQKLEIRGQVVDRWRKNRGKDLKDLREAAEKLKAEEEEIRANKLPTHGMHPAAKDKVPAKHYLSIRYEPKFDIENLKIKWLLLPEQKYKTYVTDSNTVKQTVIQYSPRIDWIYLKTILYL